MEDFVGFYIVCNDDGDVVGCVLGVVLVLCVLYCYCVEIVWLVDGWVVVWCGVE